MFYIVCFNDKEITIIVLLDVENVTEFKSIFS